jgi:quinoprotein glucose dehydrogenase
LLLEDGRILVGLIRNETDDAVALVDSEGKEQTISKSDISERKQNTQSVMPANFYELLNDETLQDLIAYLKSQP